MSNIVQRLRVAANEPIWGERDERDRLMDEAADEVERLTRALGEWTDCKGEYDGKPCVSHLAYESVRAEIGQIKKRSDRMEAGLRLIADGDCFGDFSARQCQEIAQEALLTKGADTCNHKPDQHGRLWNETTGDVVCLGCGKNLAKKESGDGS